MRHDRQHRLLWLLVAALPLAGSSPCDFDESSDDSNTTSADTRDTDQTDTSPGDDTGTTANDDDAVSDDATVDDATTTDDSTTTDDDSTTDATDDDDTDSETGDNPADCQRDRNGYCCEDAYDCFPECGCDPCNDVQCSDDLTCLDGFCITPATMQCVDEGGCITSSQCTTKGHACRPPRSDATCGTCETTCIVDEDCPTGTVCNPFDTFEGRFCDAPDAFCTSDDQCDTATQMCHEGRCIGLPPCWNGYLCPLFAPGEYGSCDDMPAWPDGPGIYDTYATPAQNPLCFFPPCGPLDYVIAFFSNCDVELENALHNPAFRCDARDQLCHPLVPMNIETLSTGCGEYDQEYYDYGSAYEVYRGRCVTACEQIAIPETAECSEPLSTTCSVVYPDGYEFTFESTASACRTPAAP